MSGFKKAEKKQSKLRLGISGPSGSGKTFSALRLAKGMNLKTAVIDSEKGSASLYADKFEFDVLEISPPYTTEKYQEAFMLASKLGYQLLIVDSISHAWAGEGGLLNQKEQMDQRGGNSFANWTKITPKQEKFINAIVSCPLHIIITMRSKQDYSISDDNGKKKIQKVGLAPVQREGFEYELTTVFDVAMNHECASSKDRTSLFVDKIFKITEETGKVFIDWLNSGATLNAEVIVEPTKPIEIVVEKPIELPIEPITVITSPGIKVVLDTFVNHAPKPKEPVTYKNFIFQNPPEFKGKRFDQIEFAVLDNYMNSLTFKYINEKIPLNVQWFFDLYNQFIQSTENSGNK